MLPELWQSFTIVAPLCQVLMHFRTGLGLGFRCDSTLAPLCHAEYLLWMEYHCNDKLLFLSNGIILTLESFVVGSLRYLLS